MKMERFLCKWILVFLSISLVVALLLPACAKSTPTPTPTPKPTPTPTPTPAGEPIKIGVLQPLSGFAAEDGKRIVQGIQLAFDEVNYEIAGRKIQLFVEDDQWDTAVGVAKGKKMVQGDGVKILLPYVGAIQLGLRDFLVENKVLTVSAMGGTRDYLKSPFNKYWFRASYGPGTDVNRVQGWMAYTKKGYRKAVTLANEFPAGHEETDGFKEVFEMLGGKVIQEIYVPLGSVDFAPYVSKIDAKNADMVWAFFFGADAIRFVKGFADYGLKGRIPLFPHGSTVDDIYLPAQGDAALGVEDVYFYSSVLNNPENNKLRKAVADKYKMDLSYYHMNGYTAAKVVVLGLQAVKGNLQDLDQLEAAIAKLAFDSPRGPFKFGPEHHPIHNMYLRRVEKVGGKLQNTVLETYPNIGQGWMPPKS